MPTVNYSGWSIRLWGCISSSDHGLLVRIKGNIGGTKYSGILQKKLLKNSDLGETSPSAGQCKAKQHRSG